MVPDLCEEGIHDKIEQTAKQFVPHEDGDQKIPENKSACVLTRIVPLVDGG